MNDFNELPQAKKGALGEAIVDEFLAGKGFVSYRPTNEDMAHPFDRLVASKDKTKIFIVEAKAKAARTHYPDTGINMSHWVIYRLFFLRHKINTYLVFVDEKEGAVYGEFLNVLEQRREILVERKDGPKKVVYPLTQWAGSTEIRYFPREAMREIGRLGGRQKEQLAHLSTRNSAYG